MNSNSNEASIVVRNGVVTVSSICACGKEMTHLVKADEDHPYSELATPAFVRLTCPMCARVWTVITTAVAVKGRVV